MELNFVFYWELLEAVRPIGSAASALGWLWTFEGTAQSVGSSIGGWLAEHFSPSYAFGMYTVSVILGAIVIAKFKKYLLAADHVAHYSSDNSSDNSNNNKVVNVGSDINEQQSK